VTTIGHSSLTKLRTEVGPTKRREKHQKQEELLSSNIPGEVRYHIQHAFAPGQDKLGRKKKAVDGDLGGGAKVTQCAKNKGKVRPHKSELRETRSNRKVQTTKRGH